MGTARSARGDGGGERCKRTARKQRRLFSRLMQEDTRLAATVRKLRRRLLKAKSRFPGATLEGMIPMTTSRETPAVCPACGAEVPEGALACPDCGADHETGWNQDAAVYDGVGLPDDSFDYDEFVKREFGDGRAKQGGRKTWWLVVAVVAVVLLVWLWVVR